MKSCRAKKVNASVGGFMVTFARQEDICPMNFTAQSVKPDLKFQNDDFFLEMKAPRGQLFVVLDFAPHDIANLNTALEGKIETIVESFASLSQFSADLFLGFLVKEINNFLHELTSNPEAGDLICSAAFCLVYGNKLSYFACGNVDVVLLNEGQMFSLAGGFVDVDSAPMDQDVIRLGERSYERPLTNLIKLFTLKDADVVLVMTIGVANEFDGQELVALISDLGASDQKFIAKALMEASEGSQDDRTLLVIGGPYERIDEPEQTGSSDSVAIVDQRIEQLTASVASDNTIQVKGDVQQRDLDQKLERLSEALGSKADASELVGLENEVLRLTRANAASPDYNEKPSTMAAEFPHHHVKQDSLWQKPFAIAALVLLVGVAGGFVGGWVQSTRRKPSAEAWSVRTSGSRILISRLNGNGSRSTITLNASSPVRASGEQSFSSFADVKQYVDTVMPDAPVVIEPLAQPAEIVSRTSYESSLKEPLKKKQASVATTTISFKQGDSLKKLAERYKVAPAKLIALNPNISRWSLVRVGQTLVVPATQQTARARSQASQAQVRRLAGTNQTKVQIESGDNLNRLASRHNLSPSRLKELNPQITNWSRIQAGQKVLVRMPSRG